MTNICEDGVSGNIVGIQSIDSGSSPTSSLHLFEKFKSREISAKELFVVDEIDYNTAKDLVENFHYLGKKKFMFQKAFGIRFLDSKDYIGAAVFGIVGGISTLKGWFNEGNYTTDIYELHRLVMDSRFNGSNATSFLLGYSIRKLKKQGIRAIISLADSSLHIGGIYQACNFNYYGLSDYKTDFYCIDGTLNPRGETKNRRGVWLPRTRKHRYAILLDKNLRVNYEQKDFPKSSNLEINCCFGTLEVYDKRFNDRYSCPKCTGHFNLI